MSADARGRTVAETRLTKLDLTWTRVRDSLWFVPTIAVMSGVLLAFVAVRMPAPDTNNSVVDLWLFGGGAEGARGVLGTIAGSLITVTGTIFSVTIVALQLASSQFTPRVLGSFVADRVNQMVLGIFIGTFTYTLLVLRTVHSSADDRVAFVPRVGVTLALVLLLVSIGALIVFIDHAARSIQAATILHRETQRTLGMVEKLFPERVGEPAESGAAPNDAGDAGLPEGTPAIISAAAAGYLQTMHTDALWDLDAVADGDAPITVRMEVHIGTFAFPGKVLASVWPADRVNDRVTAAVRNTFVLGLERTRAQDVEFGLIELSDIAVKALSPGINDPTTAVHAIDRLTQVLAALVGRRRPSTLRTSPKGGVRLLFSESTFARSLGLAFDQVRHYGADNALIARKLLDALTDLARLAPPAANDALTAQIGLVRRTAERGLTDPTELADVERLAADALAALA